MPLLLQIAALLILLVALLIFFARFFIAMNREDAAATQSRTKSIALP